MALYLGNSNKLNINLNGIIYRLNLFSIDNTTSDVRLLSSDNYIIQDSGGIYLIPSDYPHSVVDNVLLSLDGHILKDFNGIYLTY